MAESESPTLLILAGPNGADKSTVAPFFVQMSGVDEFVNADEIAKGLSAFHPESVALFAGRMALERMDQLAQARKSFAIETTLAARSDVGMIKRLRECGYVVRLVFVWLPSAEMAITRVAHRVRAGGHHIDDDVVRRRYQAGLDNLFNLYSDIVDEWNVCDGSLLRGLSIIASGRGPVIESIGQPELWKAVQNGVS